MSRGPRSYPPAHSASGQLCPGRALRPWYPRPDPFMGGSLMDACCTTISHCSLRGRGADRTRGPGRAAGPRRAVGPGGQRPAVHQRAHHAAPPAQGLRQARYHLAQPAGLRPVGRPIPAAAPPDRAGRRPATAASVRCSCWTSAPESLSAASSAGVSPSSARTRALCSPCRAGCWHSSVITWSAKCHGRPGSLSRLPTCRAPCVPPSTACPIAVCELPEGADLSGRDLGLVHLCVE